MLSRIKDLSRRLQGFVSLQGLAQEEFVRRLLREEKYQDPRNLNRFERRVFSQSGEDGMVEEMFRRIGKGTRTFLEIGCGDGLENNTTALLVRGWTGVWIESDRKCVARVRAKFRSPLEQGALRIERAWITSENIESLFRRLDVPGDLDFLSIDIDGNDYWVWKSITSIQPRAVVVEYNALFPPDVKWVMANAPSHRWAGTVYFGASLASLAELGAEKGYRLVGCSLSGANALFVREDLVEDRFQEPFSAERHWEPARPGLMDSAGHPRDFGDFVAR